MKSKYDFYEVVKVSSSNPALAEIIGCEGIILGKSKNETTGFWGYAVSIPKDDDLVWDIMETDLQPTGKKVDPDQMKPVETIRVQVDPKTGEGHIVDDE